MSICKLAHYAVRAGDLEASRRFYEDVLQLRPGFRPPFAFPGVWLYLDEEGSDSGVVHLVGGDAPDALGGYLGPGRQPRRQRRLACSTTSPSRLKTGQRYGDAAKLLASPMSSARSRAWGCIRCS